jgi:ABC-type thiamine transport system ATPase subunit
MMNIVREVNIERTPRLLQLEGMFDVAPAAAERQEWNVTMPLPAEWHVGVIVGPSGSGKSTIAAELFGAELVQGWKWPAGKSIVDGFPEEMSIRDVCGLLSSVGFSSPPAWRRPFRVLSNGQQFRVNLARTLAEAMRDKRMKVVDEYSSVVDRQVAQIGSAAVAKTVRRAGLQFVAVTCHYDVIDWLEPDWVYDVPTGELRTNTGPDGSRGSLWRRPAIELKIVRTDTSVWPLFKGHHYLSGDIHRAATCFCGLVEDRPAVFTAVLSFPHAQRPGWREHRTVCLPDYQGVGLGNAMSEAVASLYAATGKPYRSATSHPSMIRHRRRSALWKLTREPGFSNKPGRSDTAGTAAAVAKSRLTASFEYVGPARDREARSLGVI